MNPLKHLEYNKDMYDAYLDSIEQMNDKDKFTYILFFSLESENLKEIGWERTLSAHK